MKNSGTMEITEKEEKKKSKTPTYFGKQRKIYKKGYDFGFKDAKRIKKRMLKAKIFIQALWNLFKQIKD